MHFFYRMILFILTIFVGATAEYNVSYLDSKGVVFEGIGKARIFTDQWTVISRIKFIDIEKDIQVLNMTTRDLNGLCSKFKNSTTINRSCIKFKDDITHHLREIIKNNIQLRKLFNLYNNKKHVITKRSPFDSIGTAFKTYFGTMDNDDAIDIYSKLNYLEQNSNGTFHLIQNQISIMTDSFNTTTKAIYNLQNETNNIIRNIKSIEEVANRNLQILRNTQEEQKLSHIILEISTYILFKLTEINLEQQLLQDIILGLKNNKLHPSLINIEDIQEMIENVYDKDFDKSFLEPHIFDEIINIDYMTGKEELILKIQIPLPTQTNYKLEKLYLLPLKLNEKHEILDLNTDYLILRDDLSCYIKLSNKEFENCKTLIYDFKNKINLCKINSPVIKPDKDDCIINLYNNIFENNFNCKTKLVSFSRNILTKMFSSNRWLFSFESNQKWSFSCKNISESKDLVGQGIITIDKSCNASTPYIELPVVKDHLEILKITLPKIAPTTYYKIDQEESSKTLFNLPTFMQEKEYHNEAFKNDESRLFSLTQELHKEELTRLKNRHKMLERQQSMHGTTMIVSGISSFTMIIMLCIGLFIYWKFFNKAKVGNPTINISNTPTVELQTFSKEEKIPRRSIKKKQDSYLTPETDNFLC